MGGNNVDKSDPANKSWVCCLIDQSFFSIAPCLANPREDLPLLYKFRSRGPVRYLPWERMTWPDIIVPNVVAYLFGAASKVVAPKTYSIKNTQYVE